MGEYDNAIREAKQAIAIDPDYGNPYNDIGVYLMAQGELDEAIPWLMKAMQAKRYASPHYPRLNLGHVWILKGEWHKALLSYEEVYRLVEYPIPIIPTLDAALFLPPEESRKLSTIAEQHRVIELTKLYLEALSKYDVETLKDLSKPLRTDIIVDLLLHIAAAKNAGVTMSVGSTEVLKMIQL